MRVDPQIAGSVCTTLAAAIYHGTGRLNSIPALLKQAIQGDYWRVYSLPGGGPLAEYDSFEVFVRDGLHTNVENLRDLCRRDEEALLLLEEALKLDGHENTLAKQEPRINRVGKSREYALRRLARARPDLHERVLAQELSRRSALIEAGLTQKQITIYTDPDKAAQSLKRHLDEREIERLVNLLTQSKD